METQELNAAEAEAGFRSIQGLFRRRFELGERGERLMKTNRSVGEILTTLESQDGFHRERAAFHAGHEEHQSIIADSGPPMRPSWRKSSAASLRQDPHTRPNETKKSPAPAYHAASKAAREKFWEAYSVFVAAFREAADKLKAGDRTAKVGGGQVRVPEDLSPSGGWSPIKLSFRGLGAVHAAQTAWNRILPGRAELTPSFLLGYTIGEGRQYYYKLEISLWLDCRTS